ncbi:MAG: hypothetical protein CO105_12100 [Comamonadaceae bacterium CG_4_9_14_3_um_filter_60_33]|nr:MAG: hypothetical protein AUK51_02885 [Comamonadaceae bacterium CG2_30_59_20]PIY29646.1 MAG: hypothetical protein COZ09_03710 [Comamonadaceae bacterium CG_4_10_14_3_um_filter_60_42]PJB42046.1 MAG: hypothetical protein CO105_12100 [Comamonadaceae bacterium CG_4_9_14_3_um_filter_60_33]
MRCDDANAATHWVNVDDELAQQTYSRDADDDKFIHAALAAGAPWLISGVQDLLTVRAVLGISIVTPAQALGMANFCPSGTTSRSA